MAIEKNFTKKSGAKKTPGFFSSGRPEHPVIACTGPQENSGTSGVFIPRPLPESRNGGHGYPQGSTPEPCDPPSEAPLTAPSFWGCANPGPYRAPIPLFADRSDTVLQKCVPVSVRSQREFHGFYAGKGACLRPCSNGSVGEAKVGGIGFQHVPDPWRGTIGSPLRRRGGPPQWRPEPA
jgi:hypothetical protein